MQKSLVCLEELKLQDMGISYCRAILAVGHPTHSESLDGLQGNLLPKNKWQ